MHAPPKPSWIWTALASIAVVVAIGVGVAAVLYEQAVSRPVGEGELFARDGAAARTDIEDLMGDYDPDVAVRLLRNDLMIEAVSIVEGDGTIVASTSDNLVGTQVSNPHLLFGVGSARLTAVARTIDTAVELDGIVEWEPGDVLYEVAQPLEHGSLLLAYDIRELFDRRATSAGIAELTVQLLGGSVILLLVAGALLLGRARVVRNNREMFLEAKLLRQHSEELEATNERLRAARAAAVDALALAEEKNRIRSEFVLMINHELRTPLTGIVTGAELLRSSELTERDRDSIVGDLLADGNRLERLIARMLEAARLENHGLDLERTRESAGGICRSVADSHPRVEYREPDGPGPVVITHTASLIQLIGSLVENAFTHGADTVTLVTSREMPVLPAVDSGIRPDEAVYFVVSDDGPGIDAEFLPRIFEKFEKKGFNSGTGLGLYMAATIARALGASLSVATSPLGTTMVVAVPAAQAEVLEEVA